MYSNSIITSRKGILSILEHGIFVERNCINSFLYKCRINFVNLKCSNIYKYSTFSYISNSLNDSPFKSYLNQRQDQNLEESHEISTKSFIRQLDELSKGLEVNISSIPYHLNLQNRDLNFVCHTRGQAFKQSTREGSINLHTIQNHLFMKTNKDNVLKLYEQYHLNRTITPVTQSLGVINPIVKRYESKNLSNSLELKFDELFESLDPYDVHLLFKKLYLMKVKLPYRNLCRLLKHSTDSLNTLSIKELIEMAICVRGYLDSEESFIKYFLLNIGSVLEHKMCVSEVVSQESLIDYLVPLSLIQMYDGLFNWSILTNFTILDKITENYENLKIDHQSKLLLVLSTLHQFPEIASKYYKLYETLVKLVEDNCKSLESIDILNLMSIQIQSSNSRVLMESLFKETLSRFRDLSYNSISHLYLKYKDELNSELSEKYLNKLIDNYKLISPRFMTEIYLTYLKGGRYNLKNDKLFDDFLEDNSKYLTVKQISNIFMYLSINGKHEIETYNPIMIRFKQLKDENKITNQEVLDVVLSMSLVGLHTKDVWSSVNLDNMVYQIPKNIVVYLGYTFLITGVNKPRLWKVLLERIMENKNPSSETYEVVMASIIMKFAPETVKKEKLDRVLSQSKALYFSKLESQRYISQIPYEKIFDMLSIKYKKDIVINYLYEAPYVIPSLNIIVDPTKDYVNHPTTGSFVGEATLRRRVWNSLGYKNYWFEDSEWNKYKKKHSEGNEWDLEKMAIQFCKIINQTSLIKNIGTNKVLKLKENKNTNKKLLNIRGSSIVNTDKMRKLQSIIAHQLKTE